MTKSTKLIFVFIILAIAAVVGVYNRTTENFINKAEAKNEMKDSLKVGKWVEYMDSSFDVIPDTNAPFYKLTFYKKGQPFGIQRWYFKNGKLRGEYPYTNGKADGMVKEYYESGKLLNEIHYNDDKEIGLTKAYYENGNVKNESPFIDGKANGVVKNY